jgi:glucosyl-3-phosphoglycerate synthase
MSDTVSLVIPARNEAATIGGVVSAFLNHPAVTEIIVVDSGSSDETGAIAAARGAKVVRLAEAGLGRAMKAGVAAASNSWLFKVDGDMRNPSSDWLSAHLDAVNSDTGMVKAYWASSEDPMPVTTLVARPAIRVHIPSLSFVRMPIAGIYLWDNDLLSGQALPDDYSFDLEVLIRVHRAGRSIAQIDLDEVVDALKPMPTYAGMAAELLACLRRHSEIDQSAPLMLVTAHPDDAEIWCGGTVAKMLNAGAIVELWILTGSPTRQQEALKLAEIYSNFRVQFLGGKELSSAPSDSICQLRDAILRLRPRVLITHHFADQHPDHRLCHDLVTSACLLVDRHDLPRSIYYCNTYFQAARTGGFDPTVFIDISEEADLKYRFICHHSSQDTPHWVRMARAMDELNGAKCGVGKAEVFQKANIYTMPAPNAFL